MRRPRVRLVKFVYKALFSLKDFSAYCRRLGTKMIKFKNFCFVHIFLSDLIVISKYSTACAKRKGFLPY